MARTRREAATCLLTLAGFASNAGHRKAGAFSGSITSLF